jgi:RNA exonuclease 1
MPWDVRARFSLLFSLSISSSRLTDRLVRPAGITPKAGPEGEPGPKNAETTSNGAIPEDTNNPTPCTPLSLPPPDSPRENEKEKEKKNGLFEAVTNLDEQLTTLHAALPPRTTFILFSGHSDPRAMSALAARRAQFQAIQNQSQKQKEGGGVTAVADNAAAGDAGMATTHGSAGATEATSAVRWSTADDRALEEAVGRARMGLLFVGVKT